MRNEKIVICIFSFVFLGCSNKFLNNEIEYENTSVETKSLEQITTDTIEKLIVMDRLFTPRNVVFGEEYPEFMNDITIEDIEGNPLYFKDFSSEEKAYFYDEWQKNLYKDILDKLSRDKGLAEMYDIENESFRETENSILGSRYIKNFEVEKFISLYEKNLQKRVEKNNERAAKKKGEIDKSCLVHASVEKLKSNYQEGNFLVCKDSTSSSSSSGSYVGHASLMNKNKWDESWDEDGLGKITITSSPKDKSAQWTGKVDGVQYEPIGYWAGYTKGSANEVSIYQVEHHKTVWKSWYNTSSDCDLSLGKLIVFVSPSDLTKSQSAKFLISYSNEELYNEEN